ncbi:MAG: hypothetical protein QW666_03590, partial [Candidatus Woesearchaeota archaeon]
MRKGIMVLILILLASSIDVFAILTQEGDIIVSLSSKSDQNTFKSKSMIFRQNPDGTWYSPSHPDVRRNLNTNEVIWWGTTGGRSYMKVERLSEEPTPVIVESTQTLQQKSTTSQPPAAEAPKPEEKTAHTYPEVKKEAEKAPETKPAAPAPAAKPLETDLQKIVSDKIGTEQAVAAAKAKYEAEKKAYDAADAKHKAALDAYNANPNKETETAWHNALIELADASMKKDEAAIQLQDEQIALAQKQEEIKSFTQPERAAAIKKAKEKQERQKELLAEKESLDRDIKNTENIIDATEDRIDEIEDEEGKKAEKEYLEEYLKEQKEKLKELKKKSETNKADIEKQKPIAGAASADVRLNEIDNEIFALNRDVTVSNEEYKIRQQEREKAEKAQRLTEEQYGEYYKKALAVPEAQRTDEQKEIISS